MRGMVKMIQATSTQNWDGVILKISKMFGALGFEFWPHTHDKHHDPHSQVDLVHKTSGQRTELRVPAHLFLSLQLALAAKSWKTVDANNAVLARMFRGCFQGHEKKKNNNPLEDANSFNVNVHHSAPNQEIPSHQGITWTEIWTLPPFHQRSCCWWMAEVVHSCWHHAWRGCPFGTEVIVLA